MSPRFVSSYNGLSGVSMMTTPLNVDGTALLLVGIVSVLVIPVGLLTVGIVIWFRRKRR
jgi:hypothetical protein